jgi:hypothetical protein
MNCMLFALHNCCICRACYKLNGIREEILCGMAQLGAGDATLKRLVFRNETRHFLPILRPLIMSMNMHQN